MLAEVGGCHHEVWLCPPRIPIPAGPPVGKTSQEARASLASPGQGFWLLPGEHQAWAQVSALL